MPRFEMKPVGPYSPLHDLGLHYVVIDNRFDSRFVIAAFAFQIDAKQYMEALEDDHA